MADRHPYRGFLSSTTSEGGNWKPVGTGTVTVYLAGTSTLATIYSASTGSSVSGSVVNTSATGEYNFWVDPDDYPTTQRFKLVGAKSGFATQTWDDVPIFMGGSSNVKTIRTVSTTGNIATTDNVVFASGTISLTLYTAVGNDGREVEIVNTGGGIITINTTGGQTINGNSSITLEYQYASARLISDGSNWILLTGVIE